MFHLRNKIQYEENLKQLLQIVTVKYLTSLAIFCHQKQYWKANHMMVRPIIGWRWNIHRSMTLKCEVYFRSLLQENMNWLNAQFKI
jgi:hypothetical protein